MPIYVYFCILMCGCTTIFATASLKLSSVSEQFVVSSHWKNKQALHLHEDLGAQEVSENVAFEPALTAKQYEDGRACLETNPKKAVTLFESAAEKNHPDAQYYLALCYQQGLGDLTQDSSLARLWLTRAAEGGNTKAQAVLGGLYFNEENYPQAFKYLKLAASTNNAFAQYYLGRCFEKGYGTETNITIAVKYYKLAARQNYAAAQYRLASHYLNGKGVDHVSEGKAMFWLQKAVEQGHEQAKLALLQLNLKMAMAQETKATEPAGDTEQNLELLEQLRAKIMFSTKITATTQRGTGEK